ncbi:MAG TPA: helix-turn-helix transcriptional regulator [Thermoanaerobaculia bacterium]|jgi:AraC-like DNA-binding protein|nr:helix-turn-helix transcriptional regulator [Thermoanaerobaculia bacterium]
MHTYTPPPPLSDFVETFWLCEGEPPPHPKERILPSGIMQLLINLRGEPLSMYEAQDAGRLATFRGPVIAGPYSESFVIDTAQQQSMMGVAFKAGGAFPFFKPPAGELQNAHVALDTLWGVRAAELHDRLLAAPAPAARFRILEEVLLRQAARNLARHPAVSFALHEFLSVPQAPVAGVTDQIGLSARRFIQVFSDEVGLTPKLFCRIRRFQEVLRLCATGRRVDWTEVALSCGYFDQAHFIHDFRAFSGFSPSAFLACRTEFLNHLKLGD